MTLWDAVTGKPLHTFRPEKRCSITSGHFLTDGKTVVTLNTGFTPGDNFTALYFWDVGSKLKPLAKGPTLEAKALARLWEQMGGSDTLHARQALWALVASPAEAVPFLAKQLRPAPGASVRPDDAKGIDKLIATLNSPHYPSRVHARVQLERLDRHAEPALRRTLKKPASLQQKKEIETVLKALEWPYTSPDRLQRLRAIEALERIGTPEARKVLEEMGKGAPQAPETEDAKASLQRLAKQAAKKP